MYEKYQIQKKQFELRHPVFVSCRHFFTYCSKIHLRTVHTWWIWLSNPKFVWTILKAKKESLWLPFFILNENGYLPDLTIPTANLLWLTTLKSAWFDCDLLFLPYYFSLKKYTNMFMSFESVSAFSFNIFLKKGISLDAN